MKKGQAALEYLFTYGWAFLAILLTLGTLAYFGVFDINNLRGETCRFPPGIVCEEYALTDSFDTEPFVYVELRNVFGAIINVTEMNLTGAQIEGIESCDVNGSESLGEVAWEHEQAKMFRCDFPNDRFFSRQTYELVVSMQFSQPGHTYIHTTSGALRVTAQ
ncbi:MAG: hypothetical protein ACMXYD_02410 [Candidatus Woesearchaeota archaeon]